MDKDDIDVYITQFEELARKALYHENDPAVLRKFQEGLPLRLLKNCMNLVFESSVHTTGKKPEQYRTILTQNRNRQFQFWKLSPGPGSGFGYSSQIIKLLRTGIKPVPNQFHASIEGDPYLF